VKLLKNETQPFTSNPRSLFVPEVTHFISINLQASGIGLEEQTKEIKKSRLPRTRRALNREDLAAMRFKRNAPDCWNDSRLRSIGEM